jgi:hypothetical protein
MTNATLKKTFSMERTALLVRNRAFEDFPSIAIVAGILAGINLLSILIVGKAVMNDPDGQSWSFVISLAGLILASSAFKGMHDGRSGTDWLLLPATSLEKYAAALVSYLILLPIAAAIATTGLSALLSLVELIAGGQGGRIWNPIQAFGFEGWVYFATGALVFAAGSATFRKRALIKTLGIVTVTVLFASGLLFVAFIGVRNIQGLPVPFVRMSDGGWNINGDVSMKASPAIDTLLGIVRYALVPLFTLLYGYFRVAEKEARDEVQ